MKVRDLFGDKVRPVHTIARNRNVADALNLMAEQRATALIVTDNDQPVGIFTERDVFRYFLHDQTSALSEISLPKAMSDKLIAAVPEDDLGEVMSMMIKADIKHLPILEAENITRMLTMNDLIEYRIESLSNEINQLQDYIEDLHEAGKD